MEKETKRENMDGNAYEEMPDLSKEVERIVDRSRAELLKEKHTAAWLHYMGGLGEAINFSFIAKEKFNRSPGWLLQRMHGYEVNGKKAMLKAGQYQVLTAAFRDIAAKLLKAADDIDAAAEDGECLNE